MAVSTSAMNVPACRTSVAPRSLSRVDQRDAEAVDHEREDDGDEVVAGGNDQAAAALDEDADGRDQPLVLRERSHQLDGDEDAEDVREERRQPDESNLPFLGIHRRLHVGRYRRLEERQVDVGDYQCPSADSDVQTQPSRATSAPSVI